MAAPHRTSLFWLDKFLYVGVILSLGWIPADYLVMGVYMLLLPYLYATGRRTAVPYFLLASVVALVWMVIAKNEYGYNQHMLVVYGINLFAFFAWASGLFGAYLLFSHWDPVLKNKKWIYHFLLFLAIYWPILITVETLAYYVFDIQNVAAAPYPGLPLCECIHAPRWMQAAYLGLGPVYFGLVKVFDPWLIPKRAES